MPDTQPPIIGVTCTTIEPEHVQRPPRLGQNQTYLQALVRAGAVPLLIPHLTNQALLRPLYELTDGLLLPGGGDVAPARYGELSHEKCGPASFERDETELTLTCWAMNEGKPLLAICRGIQVLNIAQGGSLYQDIAAQVPSAEKHDWYPEYPRDLLSHSIDVTPQTRLAHILGETTLAVNSLHHQALKAVAPGLVVAARAPDGIVEAVETKDHAFALGVQWHPEELIDGSPQAQQIFDALVEACHK
jgi:putative glutamine amidotransferase